MIPLRDTIPSRRRPVVMWMLIFINTAVFLFMLILPTRYAEGMFYVFGVVPARFFNPEKFRMADKWLLDFPYTYVSAWGMDSFHRQHVDAMAVWR